MARDHFGEQLGELLLNILAVMFQCFVMRI